jgi:hypothetical protein
MDFSQVIDSGDLNSHENVILAVLSNAAIPPDSPDYTIDLQSVDISQKEFLDLFFHYSTNHFHINSSNTFSKYISLKDKQFISNANQLIPFNFNQTVLSKLAEKDSKTNNSVNTLSKMTALKASTQINTLAHVRGFQQSMTWYETIDLLLSSNIISASSNPLAVGIAGLTVQFVFVEPASNLSLAINYHYNVSIPGYTSVKSAESTPFTYSLDESFAKKSVSKPFIKPIVKSAPVNTLDDDDDSFVPPNQNDDDEESIGYSITNSIMQQIKLVQQDSSSDGDTVSMGDDADTWA